MSRIRLRFAVVFTVLLVGMLYAIVNTVRRGAKPDYTGTVTKVDDRISYVQVDADGETYEAMLTGIDKMGHRAGDTVSMWCTGSGRKLFCSAKPTRVTWLALVGGVLVLTPACLLLWWPLLAAWRRNDASP